MDNSLKKRETTQGRGAPSLKSKPKTLLIGKELKTKYLQKTAAERGKRDDNKTQPKTPDSRSPTPPFSLVNSARPSDRPAAVQDAKRRSEPLTARTDPRSSATRERGFTSEGEGPVEEAPGGACADARGDTLLVELRALLHIHPHPQTSKRLHLRFYLGRADHPQRVK